MKKLIIIVLSLLLLTSCSIKKAIDTNIYTGSVEGKEINLKSEVSGKIEEIYFIEGQKINKLDTLIKINDTNLKLNLKKVKILKEISEITYQDLLNGVNQYDLKTQQNVINSINNQLNEASNNQIYFKKQYDDNKKLFDSGSISKSKLDEIKLYLDNANSKIELLKQEKNAAINNYNKLETLITNETIDKAKKEIELRELDITDIENNIKKTIITSPIDGIIQNINYAQGEIINQNSSLITIINQDNLFLNIYVAQKYLKDISIGQKVYFEDEFINSQTYGLISFISDKAEFTPKNVESKENKQEMIFKIKIDIINPQNIKPGMYITANLNGDYNE
ncbi:MAG: HlyD family efflux transporter periplasmic adaptor subunit [Bacillota bacterium]|nr:HlyD family efflux transporter periplasmic adaptor subunit [Bacillota bacterium]